MVHLKKFVVEEILISLIKRKHVYINGYIDVYFTNNRDSWKDYDVNAYMWNSKTNVHKTDWPGDLFSKDHVNDMGQNVYKIQVNLYEYDRIIFSVNNGAKQTIDISLTGACHNRGYYISDTTNSSGKYPVGTWTYSS